MKGNKKVKSNFIYTAFLMNENKSKVIVNKLKSNENVGCSVRISKNDTKRDLLNKIEYIYLFNKFKLDENKLTDIFIDIPENDDSYDSEDIVVYGIYIVSDSELNEIVNTLDTYRGTEFIKSVYVDEIKNNTNIYAEYNHKYMMELIDIIKNRITPDGTKVIYEISDEDEFDFDDMNFGDLDE